MLKVHHLGLSQSERIVWLCEELEIPYDLIRYERDSTTKAAPPEYKALHPAGTAPVITDGDIVLAETNAIVEYLMERYGGGRLAVAADDPEFSSYLFWLHYANGSMVPAFLMDMVGLRLGATGLPSRSDTAYELVEQRLGQATWFAGDAFSAADILMVFPVTNLRVFSGRDISGLPNLLAYLRRVGERPAYRRAMKKAEPDLSPRLE